MAFLTKADFNNSEHVEIINILTRGNDDILNDNIIEAVSEMASYLSARYNVDAIFDATGNNRHPVIKMYCKDLTLYHLHSIHNPAKMPEIRAERYDHVIRWLEQVGKEMINPPGLPKLTGENDKSYINYGSNEKRNNHF